MKPAPPVTTYPGDAGDCIFYPAGDFVTAIERGDWDADDIGADLPELVTGAVPPRCHGRRYFRSTGLGIEDLAVASLLS